MQPSEDALLAVLADDATDEALLDFSSMFTDAAPPRAKLGGPPGRVAFVPENVTPTKPCLVLQHYACRMKVR